MRSRLAIAALLFALPLAAACKGQMEVEPGHGIYTGGDSVTIHAHGIFPVGASGVAVHFGANKCSYVDIKDSDTAEVVTPPGDANSTVDVEIDLPDGRRFEIPKAFKYVDSSSGAAGAGWGTVDGGKKQ